MDDWSEIIEAIIFLMLICSLPMSIIVGVILAIFVNAWCGLLLLTPFLLFLIYVKIRERNDTWKSYA